VHDVFVAHVVLKGSGVMPVVGELIAGGVSKHVRVDRENGSFAVSPVRAIILRKPAVVAGPPRSVTKTYRDATAHKYFVRRGNDGMVCERPFRFAVRNQRCRNAGSWMARASATSSIKLSRSFFAAVLHVMRWGELNAWPTCRLGSAALIERPIQS
jgi:hypothetical protein